MANWLPLKGIAQEFRNLQYGKNWFASANGYPPL